MQRDLIEGSYLDGLADVNHVEELFRVAPLQRYELSVTGGSERTTYAVSGSFFDQDGIIKNSGYKKISFRSNVQSDVKPWLNVGMNVIGSMAETQSIPSSGDGYQNNEGGSAIRYALFRTPAIPTITMPTATTWTCRAPISDREFTTPFSATATTRWA